MAKRQNSEIEPEIIEVAPRAAIPGGEFIIRGKSLTSNGRPSVRIGEVAAPVVVGSRSFVVARVPEGASVGEIVIGEAGHESKPWACDVGIQIADGLHPVANPAVDAEGNTYVTFSGSRGQKTPVSVFKIDTNYTSRAFITDLMNATGLAFDREGMLYISSRSEGSVYQSTPNGNLSVYVEGMGIGTGLAFDRDDNLYVGDRSGTIFKISRERQIYVFATVEPSIAAYHLAFGPDDHLYITGPTTSSYDSVHRVTPDGAVETYYRGLGRPQGIAFDAEGRLYVAASLAGRRGVVRIDQDRNAELFLSGPNIVGLAFMPSRALAVATSNALYRVDVNIAGQPLPQMNATVIAVGSEMLTPDKTDTNSLYLTDQLNTLGIEVVEKYIVGDDRLRLANLIAYSLGHSELILITGGLGPTEDDVTRDSVSSALGRAQFFSEEVRQAIEDRFRRLNRRMVEVNLRQAQVVDGAEVLPNDRGTAPGQWIEIEWRSIVMLPGPPKEMKAMFELQCLPRLLKKLPPMVIRTRFYRVSGMPESDLDQLISPVYTRYTNPMTTILAAPSDIQIHLRARCATVEEAEALLADVGGQIEPLIGDRLYTCTGEPLEACVGAMLLSRNETLSVAESCTGGTLAGRITETPGSSAYFKGGYLTYSSEAKTMLLGVPEGAHPVSEPTARAMAEGARERMGTSWAISITGEAGPLTETDVPAGTVFIGIAGPNGTDVNRYHFLGDRSRVRVMAVQTALDALRLRLR